MAAAWTKVRTFFEMIKFEHSIFALPFAYLGLFLGARGWPGLRIFLWVTVAMVTLRTFGMGVNRLIDLPIDAANPRTKNRALPAGALKVSFVWGVSLASLLLFEFAAWSLGPLCFSLSPIPAALAFLYPWTKRFTWFSHGVLGIILALAPYGAWLASRSQFSWIPGLISLGVFSWVMGFDIVYALQDVEFDRSYGLYSIPARFSPQGAVIFTRLLHGLTLLCWSAAGWQAQLGGFYILGMLLTALILVREHWLIQAHGLDRIQEAFFTLNAVVSAAVFIAASLDLFLGKRIL